MFFEITHKEKNSRARAGVIHTAHGDIETPVFMPVGTQATVKSLDSRDIGELGAQVILANTYHLHLRPGEDLIASFGGLHKFMNWDKPILTDSGGFQVFSLGAQKNTPAPQLVAQPPLGSGSGAPVRPAGKENKKTQKTLDEGARLVRIDEDGVDFRSHIDGSLHRFTPETAMEIQHKLGADIIMAFDECTPDEVPEQYAREAMERTHQWAERCLTYHRNTPLLRKEGASSAEADGQGWLTTAHHKQFLFGIIQGAKYLNLRKESARFISGMDFDGIAIGGESIGFNMEATKEILDAIIPLIPENKPHYTMGVGFSPLDLFEVVERGVDMFDCVAPTRMARNGTLFVHKKINPQFRINITNAAFREDKSPIDPQCSCSTCQNYSRAYLHHLFDANELLAYRLSTIHNVHFFLHLMSQMRLAIKDGKFLELKKEWVR